MQLIECIPNFSEGRNVATIEAIATAIRSIKEVKLLHIDRGEAANRTVFTFVGPPKAVIEAAFQAIQRASQLIDMRQQTGEHPRIGATDVCPLVPIANVSIEEVILYAHELGQRVGDALDISVYLYEHTATRKERKNLATIRSGEYEGFAQKMQSPDWQPDYGPLSFNPKSGATVLGARDFLIAYNVNLDTDSVAIATEIARTVRESGRLIKHKDGTTTRVPGQLKYLKAIGWYIEEYGKAQVSMNLTNLHHTGVHHAYQACVDTAAALGVAVTGSELIGLIPQKALVEAGQFFLNKKQGHEMDIKAVVQASIDGLGLAELAPFEPEKRIIEWLLYC